MQKEDPAPAAGRQSRTDRMIARAWSGPETGLLMGGLFLFHLLLSLIAGLLPGAHLALVKLSATLLIYVLVTGLIIFILRHRRETWQESFGMSARQLPLLVWSPLLYAAMLPLLMLTAAAWHLFLRRFTGLDIDLQDVAQIIRSAPVWLRVLYITMAVLITPVYEEILFRGTLFPFLFKQGGELRGTLMVSMLFAALHFHLPSFLPLIVLSAALCMAYKRTGSLWICIGAHVIFNAVSILTLFLI